jgi:hypothetical protein
VTYLWDGDFEPITLNYQYDKVNRLTRTDVNATPEPNSFFSESSHLKESFVYDEIGRFKSKWEGTNGEPETDSKWVYNYYLNSSRMKWRKHGIGAPTPADNYYYDYYGNMICDLSKKTVIDYDWRNLPWRFRVYSTIPNSIIPGNNYVVNGIYFNSSSLGNVCSNYQQNHPTEMNVVSEVFIVYDANGERVLKIEK